MWKRYLTASDAIALASLMLQRGTMRIQNAIAALAALSLSGCSYICDLKVIVLNGKIAFIVDPDSKRQANCITSIHVQATNGETARAALDPRDDEKLVRNGVFWWKDFDTRDCPNRFPIRYGQQLEGRPFVYSDGSTIGVEAKPLIVGVIYDVDTGGSGSGYGGGRFRIREDRTVENLSLDI